MKEVEVITTVDARRPPVVTIVVTRVLVGLGCAFAGLVAGGVAIGLLALVPRLFGLRMPPALFTVSTLAGAAAGFALSFRIPDGRVGLRTIDSAAVASPPAARAVRGIFISMGLLTYPAVLSYGWSGSWWLMAGWIVGTIALGSGVALGSQASIRALVPLVWVPILVLLPALGAGLFLAPAAIGLGLAALVPDTWPVFKRTRALRALALTAALVLIALALIALGSPRATMG